MFDFGILLCISSLFCIVTAVAVVVIMSSLFWAVHRLIHAFGYRFRESKFWAFRGHVLRSCAEFCWHVPSPFRHGQVGQGALCPALGLLVFVVSLCRVSCRFVGCRIVGSRVVGLSGCLIALEMGFRSV